MKWVAKGQIKTFGQFCAALRATRNRLNGLIKTFGQFCAALRATPNLVAKGGIEPPTHGFSVRCSTN
jgi:sRNA-binding regulator protein Hfq